MKNKKKILITGGKGFLGKRLIPVLVKKGYKVKSFDIVDGQNITKSQQIERTIKNCDIVMHLAAVADLSYVRVHLKDKIKPSPTLFSGLEVDTLNKSLKQKVKYFKNQL
jgi:UDP-glucose 4-epimerase